MLLQVRTVTFRGSPRQVMPWATEITAYVNAHSGLQVALWMADYGQPLGTLSWSSRVESQAAGQAAVASLATDDGYMKLLEAAAELVTTPGHDRLAEIVYSSPSEVPAVGATLVGTMAVAAVDRLGDALAWSVGVAQHGESVTRRPVTVTLDVYGQMGTISWLSSAPTVQGAEEARTQLRGDASYMAKMSETKGLFIPGSGAISQFTRVA